MEQETKTFIDAMFEKSKEDPFAVIRDEIIRMLSMDPSSEEFEYLGSKARELARIRGNVGSVGIAFGLDYRPCKGNCVYCSFGEKWGLMEDDYEIPVDELVAMISERFSKGFRRFTIRTTEYYSVDRLCEIAREIGRRSRGSTHWPSIPANFPRMPARGSIRQGTPVHIIRCTYARGRTLRSLPRCVSER